MSFLKQKTRLQHCVRETRNDFLKLKGPERSDIYIPIFYRPLLDALDGTRTLGEIWRQIVIPDPKLNLKDFLYLLSELERIGCLKDFKWEQKAGATSRFNFRISRIWLESAVSLLTLPLGRVRATFPPFLWILILSTLGLVVLTYFRSELDSTTRLSQALLPIGLYLSFWSAASILRLGQSVFQVLTLFIGTGERVHASFELSPLYLRLRVHEEPVALTGKNKILLSLLYLSWAAIPLLVGVLFSVLDPANAFWWSSVGTLLFFLELNPYRDSLGTRLLSRLIGPEDFHTLFLPYLYSSSFFSIFYRQRSLPRERQMVLYSSFCVAWSLFFLNHTLSMFGDNLPILARTLGQSVAVSSVDVVAFALIPLLLSLEILIELFVQLLGNTKHPLLSRFYAVFTRRLLSAAHESVSSDLAAKIAGLDLFKGISPDVIREIVEKSSPIDVPSGRRVLVQGSSGDELMVLIEGQLRIEKRDEYGAKTTLAYVDPIHVLGETAAILGLPRQADVITQIPAKLLVVSGHRVQELLKGSPGALDLFMERISISHALSSSKTFRNLPQEVVKIVAEQGLLEKLAPRQILLKEGDSTRDFYMLVKGHLEVTRMGKHVGQIAANDTFGEISLMREVQRTASVTSGDEHCQVFRLAAAPFLDILENHPELALAIEAQADFRSETYS
jgi:CRP-like cAMP-binding protein